jgi:hypothetical protein
MIVGACVSLCLSVVRCGKVVCVCVLLLVRFRVSGRGEPSANESRSDTFSLHLGFLRRNAQEGEEGARGA